MRIFYCLLLLLAVPMVRAEEIAAGQLKAVEDLIAKYSQQIYQGTSKTDKRIAALVEEAKLLREELECLITDQTATDEFIQNNLAAPQQMDAGLSKLKLDHDAQMKLHYQQHKECEAAWKIYGQGQLEFELPDEQAAFEERSLLYAQLDAWWQSLNDWQKELQMTGERIKAHVRSVYEATSRRSKAEVLDQYSRLKKLGDLSRDLRRQLNALGAQKMRSIQSDNPKKSTAVPKPEVAEPLPQAASTWGIAALALIVLVGGSAALMKLM